MLVYVANEVTAYESWRSPAGGNVEAAEVTILGDDNTQAARVLTA